jgi:iron(III) transport system substrate-binding protein
MTNRTPVLAAFSMIAAASALLAGCSAAAPSSDGSDVMTDTGPIILYSNSVSDGRGDWLVAEAKEAGFEVEYVDAGSSATVERVIAEKNNPVADVVFGPNDVNFEYLKDADVLAPYTPSWADKVQAKDPDGLFYSVVEEPIMLVSNPAAYTKPGDAPEDWSDFFETTRFAGRYEVPANLSGGTDQMVIASILSRFRDDDADLGISEDGWKAIETYFQNGSPQVEGTDLYARIAAGEVDAGRMWLAGKVSREQEYSIATEPVPSDVGVPIVHQSIGLVAGSDNAKSEEFIDWLGSADVQTAWSTKFFTAPTNQDALANADQDAVTQTASFEAQDIDWVWVAENLKSWVEEIELNYIG